MDNEIFTQNGEPLPYGVTYKNNGLNFAVYDNC